MSEIDWAILRDAVVTRYGEFKSKLVRALGSDDMAEEVLQEVYIRLHRSDGQRDAAILDPDSYIFRVALNVAADMRRSNTRRFSRAEAMAILMPQDELHGFGIALETRMEIDALERALGMLPRRQAEILLAAHAEGLTYEEIAARFGIARRTVQRELVRAMTALMQARKENGEDEAL